MRQRFLISMAVALLLQGGGFAVYYDDLLFLRQPVTAITTGSPETFRPQADTALERRSLTVRHLDTIAESAGAFGMHDIEVRALQRRMSMTPDDRQVRPRLADALRRAGRFGEAERLYLSILKSTGEETP